MQKDSIVVINQRWETSMWMPEAREASLTSGRAKIAVLATHMQATRAMRDWSICRRTAQN